MALSSRWRKKSTGLESGGSWTVEPTDSENGRGVAATSVVQSTGCHTGGMELALLPVALPLGPSIFYSCMFTVFFVALLYCLPFLLSSLTSRFGVGG